MTGNEHSVLLVDDEEKVLHSLKRLLRKEGYSLLTAISAAEGLKLLEENDIHLVISDHRMPQVSGIEFFAIVKERYPEVLRIILTGYTEVDSITDAINKGDIYKFFLKPWNDQSLKLEIRQALDQYDLSQANIKLHKKILETNEELVTINENLERLVQERTMELELHNQALELSRAILEDLALPIIGVSSEGIIVLINREAKSLKIKEEGIEIGREIDDYLSPKAREKMISANATQTTQIINDYDVSGTVYDIDIIPLTGRFLAKGVILTLREVGP